MPTTTDRLTHMQAATAIRNANAVVRQDATKGIDSSWWLHAVAGVVVHELSR